VIGEGYYGGVEKAGVGKLETRTGNPAGGVQILYQDQRPSGMEESYGKGTVWRTG
jgi:hypothetical protein